MGGTTLHAGIVAQWFETASVTFLKICYYGRQWDLIWCNDTCRNACHGIGLFPLKGRG